MVLISVRSCFDALYFLISLNKYQLIPAAHNAVINESKLSYLVKIVHAVVSTMRFVVEKMYTLRVYNQIATIFLAVQFFRSGRVTC